MRLHYEVKWKEVMILFIGLTVTIYILTIVLGACMFNKSRSMVLVTREIIYQVDTKITMRLGRIPEVK